MSTPSSAVARIEARQRQMQGKAIKCTKCDSNYFYEITTSKFTQGYGSVEIQPDVQSQENNFRLLICLCGFPVSPQVPAGRKASGFYEGAHKDLRESVKLAQDFITSQDPHVAVQETLNRSAGKHIEDAVIKLTEQVHQLETDAKVFGKLGGAVSPEVDAPVESKSVVKRKAIQNDPTK